MNECLIMQVQKDQVRNNILFSATDEFFEFGYGGASVRNIALNAGVTPGNIYAYFPSKSVLFDSVLEQTLGEVNQLILKLSKDSAGGITLHQITEEVIRIFLMYKKQFMILVNGSKGTRYENIKSQLCIRVKEKIENEFLPVFFADIFETLSTEAFSSALIEGIFYLFNHYNGDENRLKKALNGFMLLIFGEKLKH